MNVASWTAAPDHPAFAGHFPGRPIVPGVVLLDRLLASIGRPCDIASAKFLSPVGPGETVEFRWHDTASGAIRFEVLASDSAAGRAVATGQLTPRSA